MTKCVEEGPKHLILDLSKIDFVDSSGLGALVQLAKKLKQQKVRSRSSRIPGLRKP